MATVNGRIGIGLVGGACALAVLAGCADVRIALGPRVTPADLQKIKKVAVMFGASAPSGSSAGGSFDPTMMMGMIAAGMPGFGTGSVETFNDNLVIELLGLGLEVVERKQLDKVTAEQALSLSGLTESDKSVALGKILAVDAIITGNIEVRQVYDTGWILGIGAGMKEVVKAATMRILDVEKGTTLVAMSVSYTSGETLQDTAKDLVQALKKKMEK